jgi:hypothetical protein
MMEACGGPPISATAAAASVTALSRLPDKAHPIQFRKA